MVKHIGTTISSELHRDFSLVVISKDTTKSKVLRQVIKNYVEENRKEKRK